MDAEFLGNRLAVAPVFTQQGCQDFGLGLGQGRPGGGWWGDPGYQERLGQVDEVDGLVLAEDEGPFNDVLEFADIAGKTVVAEGGQGGVGESRDLTTLQSIEAVDKVLGQQRNVLGPLP